MSLYADAGTLLTVTICKILFETRNFILKINEDLYNIYIILEVYIENVKPIGVITSNTKNL